MIKMTDKEKRTIKRAYKVLSLAGKDKAVEIFTNVVKKEIARGEIPPSLGVEVLSYVQELSKR
jgi:hypothetical protein